jgi:hypothetical protein
VEGKIGSGSRKTRKGTIAVEEEMTVETKRNL